MADSGDRKLYLGPKLRVLRRELGLNQTQMAEELGVSPSYLNHLERNQRPLTAQMMLRLANTYDIDIRDFTAPAAEGGPRELGEILSDENSFPINAHVLDEDPGVRNQFHEFVAEKPAWYDICDDAKQFEAHPIQS